MSTEMLILIGIYGGGITVAAIAFRFLKWVEKPKADMILVNKANDLVIALEELRESWGSKDQSQIERSMIRAELTASYLKRWLEIGK